MDKKKLLMCFHSSEYGGVEYQILDIIKGLSNEIEFYVACPPGPLIEDYKKAGATVIDTMFPKSEIDIDYIRSIYNFCKEKKIDIVHAHELKTGVQAIIAATISGVKKRIYHVHTPFLMWQQLGLKSVLANIANWIANFIVGNFFATDVLALTESIKKFKIHKELLNGNKMTIIPNAFKPVEKLSVDEINSVMEKYSIPNNMMIISTLGRLTIEKGQKYLIEAFSKLKSASPKLFLLIIGGGKLETELNGLVNSMGIKEDVVITGKVSDNDKNALLQSSNIFVFPSLAEGFGIALLEAMHLGIPSVVSDLDVLRDVGEDAVMYFEKANSDDLANKVMELMNDTSIQESISNNAKIISNKYTMEMFWDNYRNLYLKP